MKSWKKCAASASTPATAWASRMTQSTTFGVSQPAAAARFAAGARGGVWFETPCSNSRRVSRGLGAGGREFTHRICTCFDTSYINYFIFIVTLLSFIGQTLLSSEMCLNVKLPGGQSEATCTRTARIHYSRGFRYVFGCSFSFQFWLCRLKCFDS